MSTFFPDALNNWFFFAKRSQVQELMDDPALERSEHQQALQVLARINWVSRTSFFLAKEIRLRWDLSRGQTFRILDLACGGGDVLFALHRQLKQWGIAARIEGCDVSPVAVEIASLTARKLQISARFFSLDVFNEPLPKGYDLFISSLFLHHAAEKQIVPFLMQMAESSEKGFLISDLLRCRSGYLLAYFAGRILTQSAVVRTDSLLSVKSALTISEVKAYMSESGLDRGMEISRRFPLRFLCSWRKP